MIIQITDYSATLESHLSLKYNEDQLGLLQSYNILKNFLVIYILANLMPETRTLSNSVAVELLYALYEFFIPVLIAIALCYFSFRVYKRDTQNKIVAYALCPIISFLLSEALSTSGLTALIICAIV
jgi:NhaP-type Na+/H+ or K+/H+ antiporter